MGDVFLKTLQSVISGARSLEEFTHVLVSSAVEDTLLCVARDYGHDFSVMLKKYKDEVARRHAGGTGERAACAGTTKGGKKCTKKAILHGYCQQHAVQAAEEAAKRRKVEAYAAKPVEREGIKRAVEMMCGSPVRSGDLFRL